VEPARRGRHSTCDAGGGAWRVGPEVLVIGVDLDPAMCRKARAHVAAGGGAMDCSEGRMEDVPLPDAAVDVVLSNGFLNSPSASGA
jgi:arsenite methyltransferase